MQSYAIVAVFSFLTGCLLTAVFMHSIQKAFASHDANLNNSPEEIETIHLLPGKLEDQPSDFEGYDFFEYIELSAELDEAHPEQLGVKFLVKKVGCELIFEIALLAGMNEVMVHGYNSMRHYEDRENNPPRIHIMHNTLTEAFNYILEKE